MKNTKVVIIGNGIAGITAARHIRKRSDHEILVISGETDYFFSRTALMYIYMGHMKFEHTKPYEDWFWKKNRIELLRDYVTEIAPKEHTLQLESGKQVSYDKLIIATGSVSNKFGWPGQDLKGVQGLYSYQDLESMESSTKGITKAVIVGGGLIGIEMAEMLRSRDIEVTFLVRENDFWDNVLPTRDSQLINRHIREHHIDLRQATELIEIKGDENGRVKSVITNDDCEIECQFVGLTPGVSPNIKWMEGIDIDTEKGVLVDEYLQTSQQDIFAIGDCAQLRNPPKGHRPIEAVWYVGKLMGECVAQSITDTPSLYHPGHWYNSAKFFDIEYQTYGLVGNKLAADEDEFYWEHKDGRKAMHFVFSKNDRVFKGINTFGIRLRHECFDTWLNENHTIDYVIEHLKQANFDPEFYDKHEHEIQSAFNHISHSIHLENE